MITITGLTTKQRILMDTMWSMQDMNNVTAFVRSLPIRDAQDCISLIQIATQDTQELEEGLDAYEQDAIACVNRARSSS
jgi:predicted TIM-barrel fold metal-dependent hydrolase